MTAGQRNCYIALKECIDAYGVETLIEALASHGIRASKPGQRGRPVSSNTAIIEAMADAGSSRQEIMDKTGLPASTVDPALMRWRARVTHHG